MNSICRQLHVEACQAFFKFNVWRVESARLSLDDFPNQKSISPGALLRRSELGRVDDQVSPQLLKNFYYKLNLSAAGVYQSRITWPPNIRSMGDSQMKEWYQTARDEGRFGQRELLTEQTIIDDAIKLFNEFAAARSAGSFTPRCLTIAIVMHEANIPKNFSQCGLTLIFTVKFFQQGQSDEAHHKGNDRVIMAIERDPRLRILSPLLTMDGIRSIAVHRKWVVQVLQQKNAETHGECTTAQEELLPFEQNFVFKNARDMLVAAGPRFQRFQDLGVAEAGVKMEDVTAVFENKDLDTLGGQLKKRSSPIRVTQPGLRSSRNRA